MVMKQIRVAVWEYQTDGGKRRRGYFGDTVDLTEDEVERGTLAGVFDQPESATDDDAQDDGADQQDDDVDQRNDGDDKPPADRPAKPRPTATAAKWAAYAKAIGIDADKVDAAQSDKDALIALVDAAESED